MDFKKSRRKPSEVGYSVMLLALQLSLLLFLRSRQERRSGAHAGHIPPIYSSTTRVPHAFFHIFSHPCYDVATAGVILDIMSPRPSFPMHFHLYHFTIARTRRLRLSGQRRRACGAQQLRVDPLTVWWCSALSTYSGLYGTLSPVDPLTVWWCSALSTYSGL